jgi:cell division protein FtsL
MAELATKIDSINRAIAKNNSDISEKQAEITNLEWNVNKNNPYSVIRITANSTMYNL